MTDEELAQLGLGTIIAVAEALKNDDDEALSQISLALEEAVRGNAELSLKLLKSVVFIAATIVLED